jgi:hypothetical protein
LPLPIEMVRYRQVTPIRPLAPVDVAK